MRNALLISLGFHIVVGLISMTFVRFKQVSFVPRDIYVVDIVTAAPARAEHKVPEAKAPEPAEVLPLPKEEPKPKEDLVTPQKKPKKPKKPKPKRIEPTPPPRLTQTGPDSLASPGETAEPVTTGDIALDGQEFEFGYYLTTMRRKIAAYWKVPAGGGERFCVVYFRVRRGGAVESPSIQTSSGNLLFDQAALRAVTQASPMPPLPGGFSDDYLGVHFSFAYEQR